MDTPNNRAEIVAVFPRLATTTFRVISDETPNYNCIAWAADDSDNWWEPDVACIYYWPDNVPRAYTLAAFQAAYATVGYELCRTGTPECGYEKIAIFCDAAGVPTHAARLLPDDTWTSKLGPWFDISHENVAGVAGNAYGQVTCFMRRRTTDKAFKRRLVDSALQKVAQLLRLRR